ncbi:hypothetical protein [Actinokineospora enzanensis]|uniref:hypothetical protein n=1 Tax=Actinokineospora enzanensis TaxID=155975 RepID=UPI0012EB5F61|nr:hypothetical protein [Actinokineospora enzanensis]
MTGASSTGHGIASQAGFVMPSAMPGDGAPALPRSASETELPLVFETSMASLQAEAHTVSVESSDGDVPAVQRSTSGLDLPRPEPVAGSPEVPTASPTEVGSESAPTIGGVGATPVAEPARPLVSAGDVAALQRSTPDTESRQAGHPLARSPMASPPGAGVESMAPTVGGVDPAASTALGRTLAAADGVPMVQRSAYASEPLSGGSSFVRSPMGSPLGAESVVPTVGGTDAVASMPPGRDLASADGVPSLQRSASVREPLSSVRRFVESPMASALDAGSVAPTVGGVIPSTRPDRVSSVADGLPEVRRASSTIDSPLIGHSPARSPMAGMFGSRPVVPTAGVGAVPVSRAVEWSVSGGEAPTLQRLASPLIGSFEAPLGLPLAPVQRSAVEQVSPRSPQTPVQSVGPVTFAQRVESAEPPTRPSEPVTDTPAPPAGTPAGHAPAGHAPAEQVPEELVRKLFDPLLRRLKVELRLERERRGRVTDRWR